MLLSVRDLYYRIFEENITEITREDENIALAAIVAAESEARMYLSRYDTTALFGPEGGEPSFRDPLLMSICLDIAIWKLVQVGRPAINYQMARDAYDIAVRQLRDIQQLRADPAGWPYRDTTGQTAPQGSTVSAAYNAKRENDF
ncbi:hypothetical protein GCM10023093_16890 [Nemorincola caseinilytica]|uniref:DUF1320 domain-containing protein n=1 Tax=Nemorincola caseinilytica TaxID=2054315 RepID=A0ABP8NGT1_9BACT